jgi:uncharacterized SAM-binding protein YcdF (DUF218 family)
MGRRVKIILICAFLVGAWIIAAPFLATGLIVEKPLDHADAIIVLSGSQAYKERTARAAELFRQGLASRVMITNDGGKAGWSPSEQRNVPFVELEQRELIAGGVAPDAITVLPGIVSGTDDEAKALAREVDSDPLASVTIVTSAYHTRRALRTFEKILAGKNVEVGIMHAPANPSPTTWWLRPRGWTSVAAEYVKSAVYYAYY